MRLRGMQAERRPLGLVLDVYLLQVLIHHFREFIGLFLPDGLVLELVVEMVERLLHIGKADKEFGLDSRFFFRLVDRLDKLWLVEFLACHRHNTIHFRYHVYGRGFVELTAHFDEVVHVVAEQPRVGCHVCAIAFALLQFVYLQEMFIGAIQFFLGDKLIVVELREQHRLVGVVEREAETALGGDIAQLLIVGLAPVEGVHILIHVYLRIAALPCREILQPRPVVFRLQFAFLLEYLTQFGSPLGTRLHIGVQLLADVIRDVEVVTQCTLFDVVNQRVGVLFHRTEQLQDSGRVGGRPERHIAVLHSEPHQCVVTRRIVGDRHHRCGSDIVFLDNGGYITHQHAADRTVERAVGRIALQLFAHNREDVSRKNTAAVFDKVPSPDMRHLAVHIL